MINSITVEGNLTRDPEIKATSTGKSVVSFSIAHTPKKKDESGQWVDGEASFFDVEIWPNDPAYWAQRLTKGTGVVVIGRIRQERWNDEAGNARSKIKIVADDIVAKWVPTIEQQAANKASGHSGQAYTPPPPQPAYQAPPQTPQQSYPQQYQQRQPVYQPNQYQQPQTGYQQPPQPSQQQTTQQSDFPIF
jgi:single-strand DNA-binding protein